MLRALEKAGTPIPHLEIAYEQLNDVLNGRAGMVVCTLGWRVRCGKLGKR
jgi:hypothetical protein